jgi:hypothetical protein
MFSDVLEEYAASIFRVEDWLFYPEDGGSTFF